MLRGAQIAERMRSDIQESGSLARISRFLALSSFAITMAMIAPILWSIVERDGVTLRLVVSFFVGLAASASLAFYGQRVRLSELSIKETILSVVLSWITASAIVALPYFVAGVTADPLDALFEGISGFTTTGATVLTNLESVPRSILFWRSFSQWIGGIGIIVLTLAVFPISRVGMQLYKAEVSGPVHERLTPRIQQTATFLWKVYLSLTATQIALLMFGGLDLFDAATLSFSTVATGGFSPYRENVGHFSNAYVTWITSVFLFLSAANLAAYHALTMRGGLARLKDNIELRFYTKTFLLVGLLMTLVLFADGTVTSFSGALRTGFFHTVSMLSTCGFFIDDYNTWPSAARYLLLVLMFIGGCATSTSGGITCIRITVIIRHVRDEFYRLLHPRVVIPARYGDVLDETHVVAACFAFFITYMGIFALGFVLLTLCGQDLTTAFSGAAATLGNIGPGFGLVGPSEGYAAQPAAVKAIYMFLMLAGRLELFTLLLPFTSRFWKY